MPKRQCPICFDNLPKLLENGEESMVRFVPCRECDYFYCRECVETCQEKWGLDRCPMCRKEKKLSRGTQTIVDVHPSSSGKRKRGEDARDDDDDEDDDKEEEEEGKRLQRERARAPEKGELLEDLLRKRQKLSETNPTFSKDQEFARQLQAQLEREGGGGDGAERQEEVGADERYAAELRRKEEERKREEEAASLRLIQELHEQEERRQEKRTKRAQEQEERDRQLALQLSRGTASSSSSSSASASASAPHPNPSPLDRYLTGTGSQFP